jgi:hypothetical protein
MVQVLLGRSKVANLAGRKRGFERSDLVRAVAGLTFTPFSIGFGTIFSAFEAVSGFGEGEEG